MQTHQATCVRGPFAAARQGWSEVAAFSLSHADEAAACGIPSLNDPDIRTDLVLRVRREIAAGSYDTPEKLDAALARLLEEID